MISSAELQYQYNKLYEMLRQYLWPIDVIEVIADLETACYTAFPDLANVRRQFDKIRKATRDLSEDEELKKRIDEFQKLLDSGDNLYMKIDSVTEVIVHENI